MKMHNRIYSEHLNKKLHVKVSGVVYKIPRKS